MTEEFNLSDKIWFTEDEASLQMGDVKEFIRRLKDEINKFGILKTGVHSRFLCLKIDKLAGDKLK